MRVVHLISGGDVGGAKTHVLSLLLGLSSHIGVTLVCFRDGPFADEARRLGIDTRVIIGNGTRGDLRALEALIKNGRYDLVHSHGSRGNTFSALLRPMLRLPALTTIHSDYKLDYLGSPVRGATFGTLNRWALGHLDFYECVSEHLTEQLIRRGFKPSHLFTIHNGLDFSKTQGDKRDCRAILPAGWDAGDFIVGCAARLDPVKSIDTLLRAVAMLADDCPKLRLIVAGDGPERHSLEALAVSLGLGGRIFLAGWLDNMDDFYRSVDINALTSKYEGFPYALVEGARAGLATVATRVGGIPQVIDHGVNGLMFEPGDVGALAEHLRVLYNDEELRDRYGSRLRKKAEERFSLAKTIETQMQIYQTVLARHTRPRRERDGVLLCGAYGFGNAGDNGILAAALEELKQIDPHMPVKVMSRSPRQTACQFRADTQHTFDIIGLTRAMKRCELYINGGGNLIQDATSSRSLWFYLFTLWWAKRCGTKTLMYACGVGPISRRSNRRLAARVLGNNVDAITMREDNTSRELVALGVSIPRSLLTADPALSLSPAPDEMVDAVMHSLGLSPGGGYLCLSVRRWPGFQDAAPAFAALMDEAYRHYGLTTVVLPFEPRGDLEAAGQVLALTDSPHVTAGADYPPEILIGLMSRMRIVVGMRLHALIFAAGQGVPLIGVSYDSKAAAFLRHLGNETCCPLQGVTGETLVSMLHARMALKDDVSVRLDAANRLRALERGNIAVLKEML